MSNRFIGTFCFAALAVAMSGAAAVAPPHQNKHRRPRVQAMRSNVPRCGRAICRPT